MPLVLPPFVIGIKNNHTQSLPYIVKYGADLIKGLDVTETSNILKNNRKPPQWFVTIQLWADRLTISLNVIGTLLILAIMLLVNADVIGRSLLNNPISGVPEMVSLSIVAIVFLQVAQTFRMGRLTRAEAILNFVKKRWPRVLALIEVTFSAAAIFLILQLLLASQPLFMKAWIRNTYEGTIGDFTVPIWPVKLIILIGCVALIVQLIIFAIGAIFDLMAKPNGDIL